MTLTTRPCAGAGDSGKSTFTKQMKILHLKGFTDEERAFFKDIIHSNVISAMRAIVTAEDRLGTSSISPDNAVCVLPSSLFPLFASSSAALSILLFSWAQHSRPFPTPSLTILRRVSSWGHGSTDAAEQPHAEIFKSKEILYDQKVTPEIAEAVKALWADAGVKELVSRSSEYQLIDSAG